MRLMSARIEVLKQFFAAINRNDMVAALRDFDPDIVRIEPPGLPTALTLRGVDAVREYFTAARATWAEGTCEPEKFLEHGDKIIVDVYVHVRLKSSTDWISGRLADAFEFREGTIIRFNSFEDRSEALKWAGIEA